MNFSDMFKPGKQDLAGLAEKDASNGIDLVGDYARSCLCTLEFKKYKDKYVEAEKRVIKSLLILTDTYLSGNMDISSYGTKVLVLITRLKDVRMLLDTVTTDSKKGKRNER